MKAFPIFSKVALICLTAGLCDGAAQAAADAPDPVRHMITTAAAPDTGVLPMGAPNSRYPAVPGPLVNCDEVKLQAILMTPTIVVGEPAIIRLVIRKEDPAIPIVEFRSRLAYGTDLHVFVTPPRGRPYEYVGSKVGSQVPTGVVTLDKFNTYRLDYRMAMDKDTASGAAFEEPGVYRLRLVHECGSAMPNQNQTVLGEFSITVKGAEGDDAKALEFLNDFQLFECIQGGNASYALGNKKLDASQVAMFQRIVDLTPKAALRPFAMQVLADYYMEQKETDKAVAILSKLIAEYPGTLQAEEATMRSISVLHTEGHEAEARARFNTAWQDPIISQLMLPGSPNWKRYVADYEAAPNTVTQWSLYELPEKDPPVFNPKATGPTVTLTKEAIEDLRRLGNVSFLGAGKVVDEQGNPVDVDTGEPK